jgi:Uri superfamily endonuclease
VKRQEKGLYILVLSLKAPQDISVGKFVLKRFEEGVYFYVGKARNGLKGRIERHLRKKKRFFWHIDYFLQKADILEVWIRPDSFDECGSARQLQHLLGASSLPVKKFGSSDCRCPGHLFFTPEEKPSLSRLRKKLYFQKVNANGHYA